MHVGGFVGELIKYVGSKLGVTVGASLGLFDGAGVIRPDTYVGSKVGEAEGAKVG